MLGGSQWVVGEDGAVRVGAECAVASHERHDRGLDALHPG